MSYRLSAFSGQPGAKSLYLSPVHRERDDTYEQNNNSTSVLMLSRGFVKKEGLGDESIVEG
jgi:hypothetical protein